MPARDSSGRFVSANRFEPNSKGIQAMLKDMVDDLEERCERIADEAGPGYDYEAVVGRKRALGAVWSTDDKAALDEEQYGYLSVAIDAGRGDGGAV